MEFNKLLIINYTELVVKNYVSSYFQKFIRIYRFKQN